MPEGTLVKLPRPPTPHIHQDEADGPSDGCIGPIARAEDIAAGIHPERVPDRPIHDEKGSSNVGRGLNPLQVKRGIAKGKDRRPDEPRVLSFAAGHHRVDSQDFPSPDYA